MFISAAAGLGGLLRVIVDRKWPDFNPRAQLISSGFLGGEGVTGVLIAIIQVIAVSYTHLGRPALADHFCGYPFLNPA